MPRDPLVAKRDTDNLWDTLTATQKRRLHLRLRGYSYRHIARLEGVCHRAIQKSLATCAKKIPSLGAMLYSWGYR